VNEPTWEIREGDVLERLAEMPDESVHCVVTSPPYWGLRDYGTGEWVGGDVECDHVAPDRGGRDPATSAKQLTSVGTLAYQYSDVCGKCGAARKDKQLGLEATPAEYVAKMVEVFAEIRRVLREDGTCWLNLGDSYAGSGPSGASYQPETTRRRESMKTDGAFSVSKTLGERGLTYAKKKPVAPQGLKPKDLVGIPWRVAFALQADGWYLRSDIIWHKPNPMPESVRDRPTKAHEYVFLLTKSRRYHYDSDAIAEPATADHARNIDSTTEPSGGLMPEHKGLRKKGLDKKQDQLGKRTYTGFNDRYFSVPAPETRNRRTVWSISTKPYSEAHFATFPPELPELCIKAGCPKGGTVLDPFSGAGTTGLVALRLGRSYIGIELNPEYAEMSRRRIDSDCPLFNRLKETE